MKCFWAFSTFAIGGPQRRFASLVGALGCGYEHIIMSMDGCYDAESLLSDDVAWRKMPLAVDKSSGVSRGNLRRFSAALRETKPDLLLTSNWGTLEWRLANRQSKIPHLHAEDGFGPDEAVGRRNWKRDLTRRVCFSRMASNHDRFAFVAPSQTLATIFENAWGVPNARLHLIANGVDLSRFNDNALRSEKPPFVVGSVGALRPEKRFDRLLRVFSAARRKHDIELLLVGDGPERAMLASLAAEYKIAEHVTFAGEQANVAPFLKKMHIYAVTSDTEQMPISLVEAMATGLPIVATDVGDVAKMVSNANRSFVGSVADEKMLAAGIAALLDNPSRRIQIGEENAEKAKEQFTIDRMAQSYRNLMSQLAGRHE